MFQALRERHPPNRFSTADPGAKAAFGAPHAAFSLIALKWRIVLGGAPFVITAVLH
jgi:hypothetical protein